MPEMPDVKTAYAKATADAQAKADVWMARDALARSKGNTPQQMAARQAVARQFCEVHIPDEQPPERQARLSTVDYTQPVANKNGRGVGVAGAMGTGFLGIGRRPAYFVSGKFPPRAAEDPIYCLEHFPLKK